MFLTEKTPTNLQQKAYICIHNFDPMKKQQLYKGSLNTIIMKLLEQNNKMYGYEIAQKVKEITQGEMNITEGALYPALHKLEAEKILEAEIDKVDGRIRKYYKLTKRGEEETILRMEELEKFIRHMQNIVKISKVKR